MATTNRFGLEYFGAEGRLSDKGYKFTQRDRQTIDALFWTLFNHDHREIGQVDALLGPQGRPAVTLDTGGSFGTSVDLYYRISYMDAQANETEASIASFIRTPSPIAPPVEPVITASITGGSLDVAGVYRYALAYYQDTGGTTRAPNTGQVVLQTTSNGEITVELPALPTGADGWHVYRRDPLSDDYYYLTAVPGPATEFVDDGSFNPDCSRKRPNTNNTNTGNAVVVELDPNDLPLDSRVTAWRIYRSNTGVFGSGSNLLATVTDTVTAGGTDLVTTYTDTGISTVTGTPLDQTSVPPAIPGLDASDVFGDDSTYLPTRLAPQGVSWSHTFLPGALTDATVYNRFRPINDMRVHQIDAFMLTAPTGADGSNHAILRVKDDGSRNAVQSVYTDAVPLNALHTIYTTATAGTFTLSYGGQTTAAIDFVALPSDVATAFEALSNITDVLVSGNGIASDPWLVTFLDPYISPTPFLFNDAGLTGGTVVQNETVTGSGGGTFTLTLDGQTTAAIDWDADTATVKAATEALSNVTTVNVTGSGTEADRWLIEFVDPGSQDVPLMSGAPASLTGSVFVADFLEGYGPTTIEIPCSSNTQFFEFIPGDPVAVTLEAEDGVFTGGNEISDTLALNDVVVELSAAGEVAWTVGVLPAGRYEFRVWAAAPGPQTMTMLVSDLDAGGTLSGDVASTQYVVDRLEYAPPFDVAFESTGVENFELAVERPAGGNNLRVDRFSYEADLPTLHAGATVDIEVEIVGAPTTPGSDVQLNILY